MELRSSVGELPVYPVTYQGPGSRRQTPSVNDVVAKKRPIFAYERELRLVLSIEGSEESSEAPGLGIDWNPEKHLQSIRVHPDADASFMETGSATVETYAPSSKDRVVWPAMTEHPPS